MSGARQEYLKAGEHRHNFHNATCEEIGISPKALAREVRCVAQQYAALAGKPSQSRAQRPEGGRGGGAARAAAPAAAGSE